MQIPSTQYAKQRKLDKFQERQEETKEKIKDTTAFYKKILTLENQKEIWKIVHVS